MNEQKIAILVDSCTDVPMHLIKQYDMYLVPLKIIYNNQEFTDGVDITAEEIYAQMATETPKTSLPGGDEISKIFDQIKADGYEKVLAVTISSGLSGTFNIIELIGRNYQGLEIFVLDTKNIAIGSGFNAIQAAEYLQQGMNWSDLIATVSGNINDSKVFFCVKTLEYLQKGGRIGLVASLLGNALNLKPIISCNADGIYDTIAKVRGRHQSIKKTMELAVEFAKNSQKYNIALVHGNAKEEADQLKEMLLSQLPGCQIYVEGQISPALGVHTGPGLVGIGVQLLH